MIQVDNLSKYFGHVGAVKDLSFSVNKGEVVGFLGPNGAGKTTTMRILTGFLPATEGKAQVAGLDLSKYPLEARRLIGYLPEGIQGVPLYHEMTVTQYLSFVAEAKGVKKEKRKATVDSALESCGLVGVRNRISGKLSKGFRQRVGLAQALVGDPEVLILDEPTIGLDPEQIIEIRELIRKMAGQRTVILSTHILPEVSMTCQRVLIINEGRLVAMGTPEELMSQTKEANKLNLTVEGPPEEVRQCLNGVPGVVRLSLQGEQGNQTTFLVETDTQLDKRRELAAAVVNNGWGLLELKQVSANLEEIFVKLVKHEGGE
ncbi:MAG: ABC transporter ATP-binding protein [Thermodesulfobacteriota bacterium]